MVLSTKKSITLTGNSTIDGQQVVYLSATIPSETGVGNISQSIQNAELYDANKSAVRRDIAEFTEKVYEIEDAFEVEAAATEEVQE